MLAPRQVRHSRGTNITCDAERLIRAFSKTTTKQIMDLIGVELKLRHVGMPGHNTFGQRLAYRFNPIAIVQHSERRRDRKPACRRPVDGMASCAIVKRKRLA